MEIDITTIITLASRLAFAAALLAAIAAAPACAAPAKPAPAKPTAASASAPSAPAAVATQATPYGDWRYVCPVRPTADGPDCAIIQQLTDSKSGAVVLLWRIGRIKDGTLVSDWQTPTGILVNRGFTLTGATEKPIAIPYSACTPNNCDAVVNLAPDFVTALGAAKKLSATIFSVSGQGLSFDFSVNGLPAALAALQK